MSDVNLLPDDLKGAEEKERQKKGHSGFMPMSTPFVDETQKKQSVSVPQATANTTTTDEKLPHVREQSYIHIDREGKLIHETDKPDGGGRRAPKWWQRFLGRRKGKVMPASSTATMNQDKLANSRTTEPQSQVKEEHPTHKPSTPLVSIPTPSSGGEKKSVPPESRVAELPKGTNPPAAIPRVAPVSTPVHVAVPARQTATAAKPTPIAHALPPHSAAKHGVNEPIQDGRLGPPPLGINLIPSDWSLMHAFSLRNRLRVLLFLGIFFVVVVVGSFIGRSLLIQGQEQHLANLQTQQKEVNDDIATYRDSEFTWHLIKNRLSALNSILKNHPDLLPAFTSIEASIIPQVTYTSVSISSSGDIIVTGVAPTYEYMAKQLESVKKSVNPAPLLVELSSYSRDGKNGSVTFSIHVRYPVDLYSVKISKTTQ